MTWTMERCLPVEKISSLESFPYRFNDADVETYQLHEQRRKQDNSMYLFPIDVFFYKEGRRWCCAKVRWDTVAVGYKSMNERGCLGQFEPQRVEYGSSIEEALDNFNTFQKEVWG